MDGSAPGGFVSGGSSAAGEVVRSGGLTWSQKWPWLDHYKPRPAREFADFRTSADVPPGLDRSAVLAVLGELVARHEALRSSVHIGPGDEPIQVVHPPAAVRPAVLDEADPGDTDPGDTTAAGFFRDHRHVADLTRPPVHLAVVERDGRPRRVLLSVDHLAADAWAGEILGTELRELLDAAAAHRPPDVAAHPLQPIDAAAREREPAAVAANAAALAYAERQLRALPASLFPVGTPAPGRAAVQVDLRSPAAALALARLSRKLRVPAPVISRLAFASCLALATGFTEVGVEVQSANRFAPEQSDLVSSQVQPILTTVAVDPAESLSGLVDRAAGEAVRALRHSQGDHLARLALSVRVQHQRGVRFHAVPEFTYFRAPGVAPPLADPQEIRAALRRSVVDTFPAAEGHDRFRFQSGTFDADATYVTVLASERLLDAARARAFVLAYERVLVSACTAPATPLATVAADVGLHAPVRPPGWIVAERSWVDPAGVRDLLLACPEVAAAAVFEVDGRLHGHVVPSGPDVTPSTVHTSLLSRLCGRPSVVTPAWYTLCVREPADPRTAGAWAGEGVLAEGDGRQAISRAPRTRAEERLAGALARHGLPDAALDACYLAAGGEPVRVPALLADLARDTNSGANSGPEGTGTGPGDLDVRDFLGLARLSDLAARPPAGPAD